MLEEKVTLMTQLNTDMGMDTGRGDGQWSAGPLGQRKHSVRAGEEDPVTVAGSRDSGAHPHYPSPQIPVCKVQGQDLNLGFLN